MKQAMKQVYNLPIKYLDWPSRSPKIRWNQKLIFSHTYRVNIDLIKQVSGRYVQQASREGSVSYRCHQGIRASWLTWANLHVYTYYLPMPSNKSDSWLLQFFVDFLCIDLFPLNLGQDLIIPTCEQLLNWVCLVLMLIIGVSGGKNQ